MKSKQNIVEIFESAQVDQRYLKVSAPMVRYSKVQFRTLVKNYGVDLCFTPMILADSFCQNAKARSSEFATTQNDCPLIVQFAANNVNDLIDATHLVYSYADGVDLNCGCPQHWAIKDGYGCALLNNPQIIFDLVRGVRNSLPSPFSMSVKIRILNDLKKTIDMIQKMESCGVQFLTVHGRTPTQKSGENVNIEALREVKQSVRIPIVANGAVKTLADADAMYKAINCSGVMAASGLLTNPALFSGVNKTPLGCVKMWIDLKNRNPDKITFQVYHHHLVFMLEKLLTKQEKQVFNHLHTFESVDEYLNSYLYESDKERINLLPDNFVACEFDDQIVSKHSSKCRRCCKSLHYCICNDKYDASVTEGSFFSSHVKQSTSYELDFSDSLNIFGE